MNGFQADCSFDSLSECLRWVKSTYSEQDRETIWMERPSGVCFPHSVPKYLFRGECGLYPATESSFQRAIRNEKLSKESKSLINSMTIELQSSIHEALDMDIRPWDSLGLLQHNRFPTVIIDFSESVEVAATFAVGSPDSKTERARIAILPTGVNDYSLVNYTEHPYTRRAVEQKAFGVKPCWSVPDFKNPSVCKTLGVVWLEFPVTAQDRESCKLNWSNLHDSYCDPYAGVLRYTINLYVLKNGKLPEDLANYLVDSVPMVPLILWYGGPSSDGKVGNNQPLDPSCCIFDEAEERKQSRRYWSRDESDDLRRLVGIRPTIKPGSIYPAFGTHISELDLLRQVELERNRR